MPEWQRIALSGGRRCLHARRRYGAQIQRRRRFSYAEDAGEIALIICYDGGAFDPQKTDNPLAWKLVSHFGQDYIWQACSEDGFANSVSLTIRRLGKAAVVARSTMHAAVEKESNPVMERRM